MIKRMSISVDWTPILYHNVLTGSDRLSCGTLFRVQTPFLFPTRN
jgi:hypothetical protein